MNLHSLGQCFKTWIRPRNRSRVNSDLDSDSGLTWTDWLPMTGFYLCLINHVDQVSTFPIHFSLGLYLSSSFTCGLIAFHSLLNIHSNEGVLFARIYTSMRGYSLLNIHSNNRLFVVFNIVREQITLSKSSYHLLEKLNMSFVLPIDMHSLVG